MLDHLIHYDKEFFLFLNNLGSEKWDAFWLLMSDKTGWVNMVVYVLLLMLSYSYLGIKKRVLRRQIRLFFRTCGQPFCGGVFFYLSVKTQIPLPRNFSDGLGFFGRV